MRIRTYPLPDDHYVLVIDRIGPPLPETLREQFALRTKENAGERCALVLVHADDVDLCDGSEALEGMVSSAQSLASGYFAERPLADSPITFHSGVQACKPEPVAYAIDRKNGEPPYVPYPGGMRTGTLGAAEAHIAPCKHLGWEIVPLYAGVGPATTSNEGSQDG